MQTTSSRYRYPFKSFRSLAGLIAIVALYAAHSASSQQLTLPNGKAYTAVNTPRMVREGSARIVQAYEPTSKLRLAISIKAPKMAEEEALLKQLQDKTSPNYHKWLTPEQWNARFAPSESDEQAVVDWATSQGLTVTSRYPNRLMVNVEGTVDTIQKAFNIKINRYEVNGTTEFSNDRDPAIPSNLTGIVQFVDGLNSIMRMRPANSAMKGMRGPDYAPGPMHKLGNAEGNDANANAAEAIKNSSGSQIGAQFTDGFYDPADMWSQQAYDWNALQAQGHCCNPTGNPGNTPPDTTIALATDGDFLNSDINGFQAQYPYLATHWNRVFVDGTPGCCDDETTLDTEWSTAMSNSRGSLVNTSYIWVYEAAEGFGDFGTIYQQMVNDNFARVANISYGLSEDWFLDNAPGLLNSWHSTFNQMIGQGWTIMAASGDNGSDAGCTGSLGVLYPESDPDVTSVGGTQLELNQGDGSFENEVAWTGDTGAGSCGKNDGGGGGGCSEVWAAPGYQTVQNPYCGTGSRSVPDVSLNASAHSGQNYYFEGGLHGVAGTSIASPMMSGFVAQENAYSLSMGNACGGGTVSCAPVGDIHYDIYAEGGYNESAPHYPFYDITAGCTDNDTITGLWCAAPGYDLATGWGSFNALQMAWAINWEDNLSYSAPSVNYSGPATGVWYNSDQAVGWTINPNGNVTGIAGFTQGWDSIPSDPFFDANRNDSNSFFSGPEFPNATSGCLSLAGGFGCAGGVSQGCHTAHVRAWSNQGSTSGDTTYGTICYDTVAPVSTASLSGTLNGGVYTNGVTVTIASSDATSGVAHTYYSLDGAGYVVYSSPFAVGATNRGTHTVQYYSTDNAKNSSTVKSISFTVSTLTTTTIASSLNPSTFGQAVTFTATVAASGGTPTGTVNFLHGSTVLGSATTTSSGVAKLTLTNLGAGTTHIDAEYVGNTRYVSSTSSVLAQVINKDSSTAAITSSLNPSHFGQAVTFKATVTPAHGGNATGTVQFLHGTDVLGTATLAGNVASLTISNLAVGTTHINASYAGDNNVGSSISAVVGQVINKAVTSISLSSSKNPSTHGNSVTFTAKVKASSGPTPTGSVTFKDGSTTLGTGAVNGSGNATFSTSALAAGTHSITAFYDGSVNDLSITSSALSQKVE
jgi:subtilase family serine protease